MKKTTSEIESVHCQKPPQNHTTDSICPTPATQNVGEEISLLRLVVLIWLYFEMGVFFLGQPWLWGSLGSATAPGSMLGTGLEGWPGSLEAEGLPPVPLVHLWPVRQGRWPALAALALRHSAQLLQPLVSMAH